MQQEKFSQAARQLCGQAALLLGWRPSDFWSSTPAELQMILSPFLPDDDAALDREALGELMRKYPDR